MRKGWLAWGCVVAVSLAVRPLGLRGSAAHGAGVVDHPHSEPRIHRGERRGVGNHCDRHGACGNIRAGWKRGLVLHQSGPDRSSREDGRRRGARQSHSGLQIGYSHGDGDCRGRRPTRVRGPAGRGSGSDTKAVVIGSALPDSVVVSADPQRLRGPGSATIIANVFDTRREPCGQRAGDLHHYERASREPRAGDPAGDPRQRRPSTVHRHERTGLRHPADAGSCRSRSGQAGQGDGHDREQPVIGTVERRDQLRCPA